MPRLTKAELELHRPWLPDWRDEITLDQVERIAI